MLARSRQSENFDPPILLFGSLGFLGKRRRAPFGKCSVLLAVGDGFLDCLGNFNMATRKKFDNLGKSLQCGKRSKTLEVRSSSRSKFFSVNDVLAVNLVLELRRLVIVVSKHEVATS